MDQLGIFAKYWEPGRVKTRLAASIGPEQAAELHRVMLTTLLTRLAAPGRRNVLAFSPAERAAEFATLLSQLPSLPATWELEPQVAGDLGARMAAWFTTALAAGRRKIILVGSDCPLLDRSRIAHAFELLEHAPVVLGPAHDGGYYLIGIRDSLPPIFEGIRWSTPTVFEETCARLKASGVCAAELPEDDDCDTLADLERLATHLRGRPFEDPALAELRRQVEQTLPGG